MATLSNDIDRHFFVTGGTVPAESHSYVERAADRALFESLMAGKFCYVLNSRQMGKSSLCVRTMQRLEEEGVRAAFVDLTRIGGRNVTAEQWYAGIASEIGRSLGLRSEVLKHWNDNGHLSAVQRLFGALRDVVLEQPGGDVVVFFDEIDATRSLSFSADEFFAAIRECYNRRVQDVVYGRLSFCLLGVAIPSDLIHSSASTPFNIGERIYLRDFTLDEALDLAEGLGGSKVLVERVFYWTNGHPFLTQSLCAAVAAHGLKSSEEVDALVRRDLFDPKARETNINLADVANRALHAGDLESQPEKFRADLLSAYERAWRGKALADDESNRVTALLKLSGMMRSEGNRLFVRNRIYRHVFNRAWVRENMPGQELRRQRRAFWLGVVRTGTISAAVLAVIGGLAWNNARLARLAEERRQLAEYRLYVSDVNLMQSAYEQGDLVRLDKLLADTSASPYRNFEWRYWYAKLNDTDRKVPLPYSMGQAGIAPDSKSFAVSDALTGQTMVYSLPDLKVISGPTTIPRSAGLTVFDGRWTYLDWAEQAAGRISFQDIGSSPGRRVVFDVHGMLIQSNQSQNSKYFVAVVVDPNSRKTSLMVYDSRTQRMKARVPLPEMPFSIIPYVSDDGRIVAWTFDGHVTVYDVSLGRIVDRFDAGVTNGDQASFMTGDGRYFAQTASRGRVIVRDCRAHRNVFSRDFPGAINFWVALSSNGQRLLTTQSNEVSVWDVPTGQVLFSRPGASEAQMSPDGEWLLMALDGTRVYPIPPKPPSRKTYPHTLVGGVREGIVVMKGTRLLTLGYDDLWHQAPGVPAIDVKDHRFWSSVGDSGDLVAHDGANGKTDIFRISNGRRLCTLAAGSAYVVDASEKSDRIVTLKNFTHAYAYDLRGRTLWDRDLKITCYASALSPDGRTWAIGAMDGSVRLLDSGTGRELKSFHGNSGCMYGLAFSHDGQKLAASDSYRMILIYDLTAARPPVIAEGHMGMVGRVKFSPDDSRLLSRGADGTLRLWDPETGLEVLRLNLGHSLAWETLFSPDGNRILAQDTLSGLTVFDAPPVKDLSGLLSLRH